MPVLGVIHMSNNKKAYALPGAVTGSEIKILRHRLKLSQAAFSELAGVSVKTVERWEYSDERITGPIVFLVKLLTDNPFLEETIRIPGRTGNIRLWYMFREQVCTLIDIDEKNRQAHIRNYTDRLQYRAFGVKENPNYEEVEEFLESRCFPPTRDKKKLILNALDVPFYDPMMIIEKTQGRMAEDDFWIRIER